MQDIRPQKPKQPKGMSPEPSPDSLPSPKQLYTKKAPKFTGAKVPVASVPVPKEPAKKSPKILEGAVDQLRSSIPVVKPSQVTQAHAPAPKPSSIQKTSPVPRKKTKRSMNLGGRERKLIAVLGGLILVVLLLAGYLFLPKAGITLALKTAPLLLDQTLILKETTVPEEGVIPSKVFTRDVEVQGASPVTSTEVIGKKATGTVQIVNRTIDEQKIKEQSRLVTDDGTLFYMQGPAFVPPNSTVNVAVEAAEAGEIGNVEPQKLNFAALDTSSQSLVYAQVTTALTGGSGEEVKVVKEADLDAARDAAIASAKEQAQQNIRAELDKDYTILEESWGGELSSVNIDAQVDEQKDVIPYSAKVSVHVFAYQESMLEETLRTALEARLDDEYMLFPEPISYTKTVTNTNWDDKTADLKVRITHTTIPTFSINTLQEKLAGRSEEEAKSYLEGLPGVQGVEVKLSPFWALRIPTIEKRIVVDLVSDR